MIVRLQFCPDMGLCQSLCGMLCMWSFRAVGTLPTRAPCVLLLFHLPRLGGRVAFLPRGRGGGGSEEETHEGPAVHRSYNRRCMAIVFVVFKSPAHCIGISPINGDISFLKVLCHVWLWLNVYMVAICWPVP